MIRMLEENACHTYDFGHGNLRECLPQPGASNWTLVGAAYLLPYFRGDYQRKKGMPNEPRLSLTTRKSANAEGRGFES